jgi:hypothetical protein
MVGLSRPLHQLTVSNRQDHCKELLANLSSKISVIASKFGPKMPSKIASTSSCSRIHSRGWMAGAAAAFCAHGRLSEARCLSLPGPSSQAFVIMQTFEMSEMMTLFDDMFEMMTSTPVIISNISNSEVRGGKGQGARHRTHIVFVSVGARP